MGRTLARYGFILIAFYIAATQATGAGRLLKQGGDTGRQIIRALQSGK